MNKYLESFFGSGLRIFVRVNKKRLPFVIPFNIIVSAVGTNTKNTENSRKKIQNTLKKIFFENFINVRDRLRNLLQLLSKNFFSICNGIQDI